MRERIPRLAASAANSEEDQRESGRPDSAGRVQASAVIWARWAEGKKARAARAWGFIHAGSFSAGCSPLPNGGDIAAAFPSQGDVVPVRVFIRQNQDFCPDYLSMGCLAQTGDMLKANVFLCGQSDDVLRLGPSGHQTIPPLDGERSQCTTDSSSENPLRIHCQVY